MGGGLDALYALLDYMVAILVGHQCKDLVAQPLHDLHLPLERQHLRYVTPHVKEGGSDSIYLLMMCPHRYKHMRSKAPAFYKTIAQHCLDRVKPAGQKRKKNNTSSNMIIFGVMPQKFALLWSAV